MTKEELKAAIKDRLNVADYLEDHAGRDTSGMFICINPDHSDSNPSMSIDPKTGRAHCFSCGKSYDIIDCLMIVEGLDYNSALNRGAALAGIPTGGKPVNDAFDWDDYISGDGIGSAKQARKEAHKKTPLNAGKRFRDALTNVQYDFTAKAEEAAKALYSADGAGYLAYLRDRGFDDQTIKENKAGFCGSWDRYVTRNSFVNEKGETKSLGIGSTKAAYYTRFLPYIDRMGRVSYVLAEITDRNNVGLRPSYTDRGGKQVQMKIPLSKYIKPKGAPDHIYNDRKLFQAEPQIVFIVEGIYDAWSIEQAGRDDHVQAVALISATGNSDLLAALIQEGGHPDSVYYIGLDNDQAGKDGTDRIIAVLKSIGARYAVSPPPANGNKSDWNEALQRDSEGLRTYIHEIIESAEIQEPETRPENITVKPLNNIPVKHPEQQTNSNPAPLAANGPVQAPENVPAPDNSAGKANGAPDLNPAEMAYRESVCGNYLDDFINRMETQQENPCTYYTGYDSLDDCLGGGLYPGLYGVGAVSSLGKTTFVTQLADHVAEAGGHVIIFSLEMARSELIAKSLSRTTFRIVKNSPRLTDDYMMTARDITDGKRYRNYNSTQKEVLQAAVDDFRQYADRISVYEGIGDMGVEKIKKRVQEYLKMFPDRHPLIVVDYLQILEPENPRASDKQNTDKAVLELKRMSRDFKLPVIAISSLNRDNYKAEISEAAFKESGAIEYGTDVLIGLQFGLNEGESRDKLVISEAKKQNPRNVEAVILKNRYGQVGERIRFNYHPAYNFFQDAGFWDQKLMRYVKE